METVIGNQNINYRLLSVPTGEGTNFINRCYRKSVTAFFML